MMDEVLVSGYCRSTDQSRIVTAELDDGKWFFDCSYGNCPHEASCRIAERLRELEEK